MRKSSLHRLKALLYTALTAATIVSCQEEKPEIFFPDPVIPQKEFKYVESLIPDTLTFNEGDSVVFKVRTIPYNLLSRDSLTIQVSDTAGAEYEFAEIKSYKLSTDSIWNIVIRFKFGMNDGDKISVMIADKDTVLYTDQTVLRMILKPVPKFYSMVILNDSISGYKAGGEATIRLRTDPWDMLFNDSTNSFTLADETGVPFEGLYDISGIDFQPDDSCWAIRFKVLDNSQASAQVCAKLACPDTIMLSSAILFNKVAIKLNSVKHGGGTGTVMDYNKNTRTFSYCLPTTTDFSAQKFLFNHNGQKITLGDSILREKVYNTLDVNQPITVSVWMYDIHEDYIVKLTNTGLPVVRIDTNGKSVTRRDTWVDGTTMRIEWPDGAVDFEGTASLKGRGNGTWTETEKKPYAIKLEEKAKILGMHKQKRWCLLANYKDRTLLRNDVSLWLARQTDMPYTVSGQFVELVWNGEHMGNYYLCEQIRIDNNRVDIAEPNLKDPEKGGMLILIDDFLDYNSYDRQDKSPMVGFRSTGSNNRYKLPYILKDPDEDENGNLLTSSSPTYQYLFNYVKEMEDAIYGLKTNSDNTKVKKLLDYDRAIDYVLIQELTMNHDSYNTWPKAGPHSAYLYKDSCGPLCYGPVWDFDYHTFTLYNDASYSNPSSSENPRLYQWELLKMDNKGGNKYYFADLAKYDSEFRSRLIQRWNKYKNVWKEEFPAYVDQMAEYIRVSESYNDARWAENKKLTNYKQNGDYNLTFQQAVEAMKTAFQKRWQWMDQNLSNNLGY